MPRDYSLSDVLEKIYHNQLALEAAVIGPLQTNKIDISVL